MEFFFLKVSGLMWEASGLFLEVSGLLFEVSGHILEVSGFIFEVSELILVCRPPTVTFSSQGRGESQSQA